MIFSCLVVGLAAAPCEETDWSVSSFLGVISSVLTWQECQELCKVVNGL